MIRGAIGPFSFYLLRIFGWRRKRYNFLYWRHPHEKIIPSDPF